jgi:hypothetical protein
MLRSLFSKKKVKSVESAPVESTPVEVEAIPSVDGEVVEEAEGEEDEN